MHPTSIEMLNLFGANTKNFSDLKNARVAIKKRDLAAARKMLGGKLEPFLTGDEKALDDLSFALKIVINIVYGLTSAKFDNPFYDKRNIDNIVAKRGALFMIDLKHAVQAQGFQVIHIKTDSIKIPNATPDIIKFVKDFGKVYGYDFEHEVTFDKMVLANDAVYIAKHGNEWDAVGAQFQHPYVYKTLFTKEEVFFEDLCEPRSVTQGSMYLAFTDDDSNMHFIGRSGMFTPVLQNGGRLLRIKDGKSYAVTGTKGWLWQESEIVRLGYDEDGDSNVDMSYYDHLVREAEKTIEIFTSIATFTQ
jgi:hypothetical protein